MLFPGETVTHKFVLPFASTELQKVIVSYKQGDDIILEMPAITSFTDEGTRKCSFEYLLTQTQALMFKDRISYYVQLNILSKDGIRIVSKPIKKTVGLQFHRDII